MNKRNRLAQVAQGLDIPTSSKPGAGFDPLGLGDDDVSDFLSGNQPAESAPYKLPSGAMTTAMRVVIPHGEIMSRTQAHYANARYQEVLTTGNDDFRALRDSIADVGQTQDAIGVRLQNGQIGIIEGSRRRRGCYEAHKDFAVIILESCSLEDAIAISESSETRAPLSLWEKGRLYERMKKELGKPRTEDLADHLNLHRATMFRAIGAAAIPGEVMQAFPALHLVGRRAVARMLSVIDKLGEEHLIERAALLRDPEIRAKAAPITVHVAGREEPRDPREITDQVLGFLCHHQPKESGKPKVAADKVQMKVTANGATVKIPPSLIGNIADHESKKNFYNAVDMLLRNPDMIERLLNTGSKD